MKDDVAINGAGCVAGNGAPSNRPPKITGRQLATWGRAASMLTKLAIGAALACGEVEVPDLTVTQVARMLGLKTKQLKAIAALPAEQRAALSHRNGPRRDGYLSDGVVDGLVARVGATRLMAALDRATAQGGNGHVR
jgi:hypothetical protein